MSKVIKGGTIVTADREWKSDILIEGEVIKQIGNNWQKIHSITYKHVFSKFIKHTFSHFHLKLFIIEIKLNRKKEFANYEWVLTEDIVKKPSSVLMKKIQGEVFC